MAEQLVNLIKAGGTSGGWTQVTVTPSISGPLAVCFKNESLKLAMVYVNTANMTGNSFTIDISNAPCMSTTENLFAPLTKNGYMSIQTSNLSMMYIGEAQQYSLGQFVYPLA